MREKWINLLPKIIDKPSDIQHIKCPNCGECEVDYLYVGEKKTRIGYMQVWCNKCMKGIYVSRVMAPTNARFVTFDEDVSGIVPKYKFDD
ncbi:MAG: hypothetical protein HDR28_02655 [Lachnospiraceae bacterium]|nr:hypothetical protein [Lachnospiraceae bacterium]